MLQVVYNKVLGIEVSDHQMKIVELKKSGKNKFWLTKFITMEVPQGVIQNGVIQDEDKLVECLKDIKKQYKLRAQRVHISINSTNILLRPIHLEPLPKKYLDNAIELEIANNMQLPFTDFTYDYVILDSNKDQRMSDLEPSNLIEIMLVIASKSMLEQYMNVFHKLRMEVTCVDLAPLAMYRVLAKERGEQSIEKVLLGINIHPNFVEITIFHQSILQFSRNVMLEQHNYWASNNDMESEPKFNIESYSIDLLRELERIVNFYQYTLNNRDIELNEIVVTGQLPVEWDRLVQQIQSYFNVPTHILVADQVKIHRKLALQFIGQAHQYTIPIGLAIKDVKI